MNTTSYPLTGRVPSAEASSDVERVYHQLFEWIATAQLPPGCFLSEPELAERCGTSRTPVREALSRLTRDGWVTSFHRKGFQVRPITLKDISELYVYRRLFERYAGERAAATASPEKLLELEQILDQEERPEASMADGVVMNERFHLALADCTRNDRITEQMQLIMANMRRLHSLVYVADQVSHREIFAAVKSRDAARAASLLGEHVDFSLTIMLRSFCD